MTVALGRIQITVAISTDRAPRLAPPTMAERVHRRNSFSRNMESSRIRWMGEIGRWL